MSEASQKGTVLTSPMPSPASGCGKTITQSVAVSAPVVLRPTATVGPLTTLCQGNPTVTCEMAGDGSSCTVTLTQKICISIPVTYGVTPTAETPVIANNT